jgi:hypothetical protein
MISQVQDNLGLDIILLLIDQVKRVRKSKSKTYRALVGLGWNGLQGNHDS